MVRRAGQFLVAQLRDRRGGRAGLHDSAER